MQQNVPADEDMSTDLRAGTRKRRKHASRAHWLARDESEREALCAFPEIIISCVRPAHRHIEGKALETLLLSRNRLATALAVGLRGGSADGGRGLGHLGRSIWLGLVGTKPRAACRIDLEEGD